MFRSTIIILFFSICLNVLNGANIDKPGFDLYEDLSLNSIRYQRELNQQYHFENAKQFVDQQIKKKQNLNTNVAKNSILFLGDGMSMPTLAAARIYAGGVEHSLPFEDFPAVAMSKTYCVDHQIGDSACTATAYFCGVKANFGTIGVNAKVPLGHCSKAINKKTHVDSIAQWAIDAGKSVGLVTTTRVTHASPAGVYAHTSHRDWECNSDVKVSGCDDRLTDDIAEQLVYGRTGSQLKVIFGGGRQKFIDQSERDEQGFSGQRTDRKNLILDWLDNKKSGEKRTYVWNKNGLLSIKPQLNESVLGLFAPSHCPYNHKVDGMADIVPSLSEMVMKAIEILQTNPKGFFLFVEGGLIDYALHDGMAHIALDETIEFARSVELATNMLNFNDTMFVVTADHAHTLTLSGYPDRGTSLFGMAERGDYDFLPYLKLNFANGKGYAQHKNLTSVGRVDPTTFELNDMGFQQPATFPTASESHGGDDVAIFAAGPYSHLFTGTLEQHVIPHYMAYASCLGDGITACNKTS